MVLLAMTLTLTGAVPAGAATCVPGPGANLSSCNLSRTNLYGVNLTGANLSQANLTGANLTNANLTNANLTRATATGADFQGALISNATLTGSGMKNVLLDEASLEGSSLAGANFSGSDLTGLVSGNDSGTGTLPSSWSLAGGYLVGPAANLTNAALANVDLTSANLTGANLTGADVDGSSLGSAILSGVISGGLIGTPIALPANWSVVSGYLVGPDAFLYGANLAGSDLTGVDLTGANIEGAVLTGTNLTNANLSDVDAISATLCGSDLSGTDLSGANLGGVTSGGITGTPSALPTATPTDWQIVDGYLIGPFSDLTDAALAGANLTDSNLRSTNLTDADMSGSNLTDSSIRYTNLEDTNLTDAILTDVTSLGIQGTPQALPPGWELVNGVLEMTTIPPLSRRSATRISSAAADLGWDLGCGRTLGCCRTPHPVPIRGVILTPGSDHSPTRNRRLCTRRLPDVGRLAAECRQRDARHQIAGGQQCLHRLPLLHHEPHRQQRLWRRPVQRSRITPPPTAIAQSGAFGRSRAGGRIGRAAGHDPSTDGTEQPVCPWGLARGH